MRVTRPQNYSTRYHLFPILRQGMRMLDGSMEDTGHWANPFTADGPSFPDERFPEQATIRANVEASTR